MIAHNIYITIETAREVLCLAVFVIEKLCNGCGMCVEACPNGAMTVQLKVTVVDPEKCEDCEECVFACPVGAITGGDPN